MSRAIDSPLGLTEARYADWQTLTPWEQMTVYAVQEHQARNGRDRAMRRACRDPRPPTVTTKAIPPEPTTPRPRVIPRMVAKLAPCQCGCDTYLPPGQSFAQGHAMRTPAQRAIARDRQITSPTLPPKARKA